MVSIFLILLCIMSLKKRIRQTNWAVYAVLLDASHVIRAVPIKRSHNLQQKLQMAREMFGLPKIFDLQNDSCRRICVEHRIM